MTDALHLMAAVGFLTAFTIALLTIRENEALFTHTGGVRQVRHCCIERKALILYPSTLVSLMAALLMAHLIKAGGNSPADMALVFLHLSTSVLTALWHAFTRKDLEQYRENGHGAC